MSLSHPGRCLWALVAASSLSLAACSTTTAMQHPQDIARITDPPAKLMVRFVGDSARRTLIQYRATPDSLFGKIEGSAEGGHPLVQVAVAYDTVESIWAKRSGSGTHAMTLSAFPVLIGAMAYWILGVP